MGLANLDTIDNDQLEADGTRLLQVLVDSGWSPDREPLEYIQLLLKVAPLLAARTTAAARGQRCRIQVLGTHEPPSSALVFLHTHGVTAGVWRNRGRRTGSSSVQVARGRSARYPNLSIRASTARSTSRPAAAPDVATLQAVNAADFCRAYGLDNSVRSLSFVDQLLDRCREGLWVGPADRPADGDLIVQAAAYLGEVLLTERGGTWVHQPELDRADGWAVRVALGRDQPRRVDVLDRVTRRLQLGAGAPVTALAEAVAARHPTAPTGTPVT